MSPDSTESSNGSVLSVLQTHIDEMTAHALVGFPLRPAACWWGTPTVSWWSSIPVRTSPRAPSSTPCPRGTCCGWTAAEDAGLEVIGVMHSHTHTDPYPSPTDVAQAPDPGWHYLIVSLRDDAPMTRSFRIIDGQIHEERVAVRTDH
ncbi:MAG: M67 family metallopeptidase [Microthrixaceae bacterium]